jgi:hypothetical protein
VSGEIEGIAAAEGVAASEVLLVDGDDLRAQARPGPDGSFSFPEAPGGTLLALFRGPVAGMACGDPPLVPAPLWPVEVRPEGEDLPDALDLRLVPKRLEGIPDELLRWPFRVGTALAEEPLGRSGTRLMVQGGRWLVSASYEIVVNARSLEESGSLWSTVAARVEGGEELSGGPVGFELELGGPCTVILEIRREAT